MTEMRLAPDADPTPMTDEGTYALVERFKALKRGTEVGVGGCLDTPSASPLALLDRKKQKDIGVLSR